MPELISHIRPFTDADIDACVAICAANHPEYIGLHEIEEHRQFLTEKPYAPAPYYVIEVEGALVACGGVAIAGKALHLCWGLVHPSWHRRGLGTKLIEHRLAWAKTQPDLEVAELCTSQKTVAFYERFGFETIKLTENGFGPGLDRHDMECPL
jgi:GNAT superfamily N-acetyltransferase